MGRFLKGALAGGVGAGALLAATAAIAGTGVGGIFNLGQTNSVGQTSELTGTSNGPQLRVNNNSTAAGASALSLQTPSSQPPMRVSSPTLVDKLNADRLDSYSANQLSRVGSASVNNGLVSPTVSFLEAQTIRVPEGGYVEATGTFYAEATSPDDCDNCRVHARIIDGGTFQTGIPVVARLRPTVGRPDDVPITTSWVFEATAGEHTYVLQAGTPDGAADDPAFFNPVLTLHWTPFGPQGQPPL